MTSPGLTLSPSVTRACQTSLSLEFIGILTCASASLCLVARALRACRPHPPTRNIFRPCTFAIALWFCLTSGLAAAATAYLHTAPILCAVSGVIIGSSVLEAALTATGKVEVDGPVAVASLAPAALATAGAVQFSIVQHVDLACAVLLAACLARCMATAATIGLAALHRLNPQVEPHEWAAKTFAHQGSTWQSFLTISWLWPILHAGLGRQLGPHDAPQLHPADASEQPLIGNTRTHRLHWWQTTKKNLAYELWCRFGQEWLGLGLLSGVTVILGFAQPLLLSALLRTIQGNHTGGFAQYWKVLGYAAAMPCVSLVSAFVGTAFNYGVARLQVRLRFALVPAVFHAAVAMEPQQRLQFASGKITDLFSVDVQQIMDLVSSSHQLWTLPLQVAATLYLLYQQVHWAFAAGAAVLAVFIPINMLIARRIGALTQEMMTARDGRLAASGEMLHGILGIKQLAWEMLCVVRIAIARAEEIRFLGARKYLDAMCVYLWAATPVLVSLATFAALVWTDSNGGLTPAVVFTAVTLLNQLIFPLNAYAWVVTGVLQAAVSFERMAGLLAGGVVPSSPNDEAVSGAAGTTGNPHGADVAVIVQGRFAWPQTCDSSGPEGASSDVDSGAAKANACARPLTPPWCLDVPQPVSLSFGSVTCVRGPVGSGKSALLCTLARLTEQSPQHGAGFVRQASDVHCVYAPSQPWIRRQSLQENITEQGDALVASARARGVEGGLGEDSAAKAGVLRAVLRAVAFEEDLGAFEEGLRTPVSLQRLSGGQAARVGLARSLFAAWWLTASDPGARVLLLLDDPMAALDVDTTASVLSSAILGGAAVDAGLGHCLARVCTVIATHSETVLEAVPTSISVSIGGSVAAVQETLASSARVGGGAAQDETAELSRVQRPNGRAATAAVGGQADGAPPRHDNAPDSAEPEHGGNQEALNAEKRAQGGVSCGVLAKYLRSAGVGTVCCLAASMVVMQLTRNGADWWLAQWTAAAAAAPAAPAANSSAAAPVGALLIPPWQTADGAAAWQPRQFLFVFAAIAAVNTVATLARSFLFARAGLQAAVSTHVRLLSRVVAAPMAWFHSTPVGRVVNRFSADQYAVDEALPFQSNILLAQAFGIVGTLAVLAVSSSGVFLVFLPPLGAAYWYIQHVYRSSISRELRRLDSVTRSPLFTRFEECTSLESPGLAVLQADHLGGASHSPHWPAAGGALLQAQLRALAAELQTNQRMLFANMAGAQWLGVRLQGMGVSVLFVVAMSSALQFIWAGSAEQAAAAADTHTAAARVRTAGSAGLALAYALPIVGSLQGLIAAFAATEQEAISAERIHEYSSVQGEDAHSDDGTGAMSTAFEAVCMPAALNGGCDTVRTMCRTRPPLAPPGGAATAATVLAQAKLLPSNISGAECVALEFDTQPFSRIGSLNDTRVGTLAEPLLGTELPPSPHTGRRMQCSGAANAGTKGVSVVLENLQVSHTPAGAATRPLAVDLSGHTLCLPAGSRVAISGRTGSGKSTLLSALWRLTPVPVGGRILVDGLDSLHMPLWQLRQRMSYLPQSPVLLQGTVRDNIDPWHEHGVFACTAALNTAFGAGDGGAPPLHSRVGAGGAGLSSGTRQLLALARVLLEARPLVAVDEAAASVDSRSECRIVRALDTLPPHVTVIVIAHREVSAASMSVQLKLAGGKLMGGVPAALAAL